MKVAPYVPEARDVKKLIHEALESGELVIARATFAYSDPYGDNPCINWCSATLRQRKFRNARETSNE